MSESMNSTIEALNTVKIHMKDKDLQSGSSDLIEELQNFIENNDKRMNSMECQLKKQLPRSKRVNRILSALHDSAWILTE
jgi:hypothetical protein